MKIWRKQVEETDEDSMLKAIKRKAEHSYTSVKPMKAKDIRRCSCPEGWKLEIHSPVEPTMKILNTSVQRQKKTKENAYIG